MADAFERKLTGALNMLYPAQLSGDFHARLRARIGAGVRPWSHGWMFIALAVAASGLLIPANPQGVYLYIGDLGINLSSYALASTSLAAAIAIVLIKRLHGAAQMHEA